MKHHLILSCMALLIAAAPTTAYVQQGDTDLELLGGWTTQSAEGASTTGEFRSGATGADYDGWLVSGGLAHFTSDNLQVAVAGFGAWLGAEDVADSVPLLEGFPGFREGYDVDVDTTIYGIGGRFRWHFAPESRLTPYLGAQIFWASADVDISGTAVILNDVGEVVLQAPISEQDSASGILAGPVAGLRWELGERNDLLVEYQYHFWAGDIGDVLQDGHALFIGISHQLN